MEVYRVTRAFPREEVFGLSAQLRRAVISVGANVVEGSKRRTGRDFAHFLNIAEGSAAEAGYLLGVAADLGYAGSAEASALAAECGHIQRMLCGLRKRVTGQ